MANNMQEHFAALRLEVTRQYRERLSQIDELESSFLGPPVPTNGAPPSGGTGGAMGANIARLKAALSTTEFHSVKDLVRLSHLDHFAVRNALKSRTLAPFIEHQIGDGPMKVRLLATPKQQIPSRSTKVKGVGGMVREYLTSHPDGATSSAMAEFIVPRMKTKSKNPKNRVQSVLAKMKKAGTVTHNSETGIYRLPKNK